MHLERPWEIIEPQCSRSNWFVWERKTIPFYWGTSPHCGFISGSAINLAFRKWQVACVKLYPFDDKSSFSNGIAWCIEFLHKYETWFLLKKRKKLFFYVFGERNQIKKWNILSSDCPVKEHSTIGATFATAPNWGTSTPSSTGPKTYLFEGSSRVEIVDAKKCTADWRSHLESSSSM